MVKHGAHPAEESGVDEFPGALPLEVLIVGGVVLVELVQVGRELLGAAELVHVDVGVGGGEPRVVLRPGAHHYRQHPVSEQCRLQ